MNQLVLITFLSVIIVYKSSALDFKEFCDKDFSITNAFKYNNMIVLFATQENSAVVLKISDLKYNSLDQTNRFTKTSGVIWNEWNTLENGTQMDQLKDFQSTFQFSDEKSNTKPIVFMFSDSDPNAQHMNAYEVLFNDDLTKIKNSHKVFKINPYDDPEAADYMRLSTLFENFPSDYSSYARPVVAFPLNEPKLPQRALVYYLETDPKSGNREYTLHFLSYMNDNPSNDSEDVNPTKSWTHDHSSGECSHLKQKVEASIAISDYYDFNATVKKFEVMEFYKMGTIQIRTFLLDATSPINTSLILTADNSSDVTYDTTVKLAICDSPLVTLPPDLTTSDPGQGVTTTTNNIPDDKDGSSTAGSKSGHSIFWYLMIGLFLIILLAFVVICICICLVLGKRRDSQYINGERGQQRTGEPVQAIAMRPSPTTLPPTRKEPAATPVPVTVPAKHSEAPEEAPAPDEAKTVRSADPVEETSPSAAPEEASPSATPSSNTDPSGKGSDETLSAKPASDTYPSDKGSDESLTAKPSSDTDPSGKGSDESLSAKPSLDTDPSDKGSDESLSAKPSSDTDPSGKGSDESLSAKLSSDTDPSGKGSNESLSAKPSDKDTDTHL